MMFVASSRPLGGTMMLAEYCVGHLQFALSFARIAQGFWEICTNMRVKTAARTLEVLNALSMNDDGLTASEIAVFLNHSRQVIYHILHTLEEVGAVTRIDQRRYKLGPSLAGIASGFQRQVSIREVLETLVQSAAEKTGETAYVAQWINGDVVVVASAPGTSAIRTSELPVGTRGWAYARASGRLLLSLQSDEKVKKYLESAELEALTEKTITDKKELLDFIRDVRESKVSVDRSEFHEEIWCLAVPIKGQDDYCVSVSGPQDRISRNLEKYGEILLSLT